MADSSPPLGPEDILRAICSDVAALAQRVTAAEALLLVAGADICRVCEINNALLKYVLVKPGFDSGKLRVNLQEIWERWKTLRREEANVSGSAGTTPPADKEASEQETTNHGKTTH